MARSAERGRVLIMRDIFLDNHVNIMLWILNKSNVARDFAVWANVCMSLMQLLLHVYFQIQSYIVSMYISHSSIIDSRRGCVCFGNFVIRPNILHQMFFLRKYCLLLILCGGKYSVLMEQTKCSLLVLAYCLACFVEQALSFTRGIFQWLCRYLLQAIKVAQKFKVELCHHFENITILGFSFLGKYTFLILLRLDRI